MQLRFFTLPIFHGEPVTTELNRFLAAQRIVSVEKHFVANGENSVWSICVAYEAAESGRPQGAVKRGKVDYREVLSEADFAVYARLRNLRKDLADHEGIPAYAVFTNEQMAEMVQVRAISLAALRDIGGIGEARAEKYGEPFLTLLRDAFNPVQAATNSEHEA